MSLPKLPKGINIIKAEKNPIKPLAKPAGQVWRDAKATLDAQWEAWAAYLTPDESKQVKNLSMRLDVDKLTATFRRHAGLNDLLTKKEYEAFAREVGLTRTLAAQLWTILDEDRSGAVTTEEFQAGLLKMRQSRAWLRFCPTCRYDNACAYCQEVAATCSKCTEVRFCAEHWDDHPARARTTAAASSSSSSSSSLVAAVDGGERVAPQTATEWMREHMLTRPLEMAYASASSNDDIPVEYKARLRRVMRSQQEAAHAAALAAQSDFSRKELKQHKMHGEGEQGDAFLVATWNPGARGSANPSIQWAPSERPVEINPKIARPPEC